jgi:hypothetical protein
MMVSCIKLFILWHCNIINSRAKNYLAESQSPFTIGPSLLLVTVIRKELTVYE